MVKDDVGRWRKSIRQYMRNVWNILDLITTAGYFMALVLRFVPHSSCLVWARIIGSLANMGLFMRLLDICSVSKRLGPKIVMIGEMVINSFSMR